MVPSHCQDKLHQIAIAASLALDESQGDIPVLAISDPVNGIVSEHTPVCGVGHLYVNSWLISVQA